MAGRITFYTGLTRTGSVQLNVETTTATFPAYATVVSTAEGLSISYYSFSLERDPRFNSTDFPTEFFSDIETALGITLVDNDVFVAAPIQDGLTREARQTQLLDIAQLKRQGGPTADNTKHYYRTANTYDKTELPTQYSGDTLVDNPNVGGLQTGRPWD